MNTNSDYILDEMDKMANPKNWEKIICAANHYDDEKKYPHQPVNIQSGFVICGQRHHNCIQVFSMITANMEKQDSLKLRQNHVQGFITTKNRFVDRYEAMNIAINTGQCQERNLHAPHVGLFSEDLY